jgi:hypothetical protein
MKPLPTVGGKILVFTGTSTQMGKTVHFTPRIWYGLSIFPDIYQRLSPFSCKIRYFSENRPVFYA